MYKLQILDIDIEKKIVKVINNIDLNKCIGNYLPLLLFY